MSIYRFAKNDIFVNQVKTYPDVSFLIYDQRTYYNNIPSQSAQSVQTGRQDLYQLHLTGVYPYIVKNGDRNSFKHISQYSYNTTYRHGDRITGSYPLSASIKSIYYAAGQSRPAITSLTNILTSSYTILSRHFEPSSATWNKAGQEMRFIDIPSIFIGSSIRKGSVSCKFFISGTLAGELRDDRGNGELRQAFPYGANSGNVAGVVLYSNAAILLTGSWAIDATFTEDYGQGSTNPRWIDFATTGSSTIPSSSFALNFQGTQFIPTLMMFAHMPKGELNFSNNPSFISYGQTGSTTPLSSSTEFKEYTNIAIKNINKSNFTNATASFENVVYISGVKIYDKDKNVIAIGKFAVPVRKKEVDEHTVKLKLDI